MKLENNIKQLLKSHLFPLDRSKHERELLNRLTLRDFTFVQDVIGNMIEKYKVNGVSLRELQTRLRMTIARTLSLLYTFNSKLSDLCKQVATIVVFPFRPLEITNQYREVNNIMKNFITRIILSALIIYGLMTLGGFGILGVLPFLGIFFKKDKTNSNPLPSAYIGVRDSNLTKTQYIDKQIKTIDLDDTYAKVVSDVTRKAEQQWNDDHPYFDDIQTHIADKDYCELVETYSNDGLTYAEAFKNIFIIIIKDGVGVNIGDDQYTVDKTIGEFIRLVFNEHCLDCYAEERSTILNVLMDLRDNCGVQFNTIPSSSSDTLSVEASDEDTTELTKEDNDDVLLSLSSRPSERSDINPIEQPSFIGVTNTNSSSNADSDNDDDDDNSDGDDYECCPDCG